MNTALQRKVTLVNPHGLHLRPIRAFVETVKRFQSSVTVSLNGQSVDGSSPLDLMLLGAECGSELTLEAEGADAPDVLDALALLLSTPPPPDP
jgi:phosphocarrier protein NPr